MFCANKACISTGRGRCFHSSLIFSFQSRGEHLHSELFLAGINGCWLTGLFCQIFLRVRESLTGVWCPFKGKLVCFICFREKKKRCVYVSLTITSHYRNPKNSAVISLFTPSVFVESYLTARKSPIRWTHRDQVRWSFTREGV